MQQDFLQYIEIHRLLVILSTAVESGEELRRWGRRLYYVSEPVSLEVLKTTQSVVTLKPLRSR